LIDKKREKKRGNRKVEEVEEGRGGEGRLLLFAGFAFFAGSIFFFSNYPVC
jgi:hypothetical protein